MTEVNGVANLDMINAFTAAYPAPDNRAGHAEDPPPAPSPQSVSRYAAAALQGEIAKVQHAQQGHRNQTLNKAAFNLGMLIAGGALDPQVVEAELLQAARECGYVSDHGERATQSVIASGLEAGMKHPRQTRTNDHAPDPPATPTAVIAERAPIPLFGDDIANSFLVERCVDSGSRPLLFFWNKRLYRWLGDAWSEVGGNEVLGEMLRAFMAQRCDRPVDDNGNERDLPWTKADHAAKIVLNAIRVPTEVALPARARMVLHDDTPRVRLVVEESLAGLIPFSSGWGDVEKLIAGEPYIIHGHDASILCDRPIDTVGSDYDPAAECPRWLQFLDEIMEGDVERIAVLQGWCGYHLLPDARYEKFAVLIGPGQNGKGRFLRVLEALVGAGNYCSVPVTDFGQRFALSQMRGMLANVSEDLDRRDTLDLGKLKSLVSGDKVVIDIKFRDPVSERLTAKHTFATNHDLNLFDSSKAMERRLLAIPFRYIVPEEKKDPRLFEDKLLPELPGILRWAVDGLRRLLAQKGFSHSRIIEAESTRMLEEANPSFDFFDERIEVGDAHDFISAKQLVAEWRPFAEGMGLRERGFKSLKAELMNWGHSRGVTITEARRPVSDGSRERGYRGIRLRPRFPVYAQAGNRLFSEN